MNSRTQFETRFPIPEGLEWDEQGQRYQPIGGGYTPGFSITRYEAYVSAWVVWQASREVLVIELPSPLDHTGCEHAIDSCAEAIKAAGVRVKP